VTETRATGQWLTPFAAILPQLRGEDWAWLHEFEADLTTMAATEPTHAAGQPARAAWLLEVRRHLARGHPPASTGEPGADAIQQALVQFVCGFYDLDLRDAYGPGHGALILAGATEATRRYWAGRLAAGELVGIAATERHGGSRIQEITTSARLAGPRRWAISGEKCWVSRLVEASGIVVFFRDPDGRISAAIVDAATPGIERELLHPAGLAGWSWGILRLHEVGIDPDRDLLAAPGHGLGLFRRHFTAFRPLVAATALGTAAGVHTTVTEALAARSRLGVLPRVRDNALITLGRTHAELCAALLAAAATSCLAATGERHADLWARVGKAHGVDTAHRAVTDLVPLLGAAGFQVRHPVAKARHDLTGLLYADGIHDSLYRSGGTSLLHGQPASATAAPPPTRSAVRADLDRAA
jgi:alkylation response protein AidB-like acyl-CoA dehydrogenase